MDKELDKLSELQQELYAMKQLGVDEDLIKLQEVKIKRQESKIIKMQNNE